MNNNKLTIGEVVYMIEGDNILSSMKGSVVKDYGFDEFDELEREVYRVKGDNNKDYIYHYPSDRKEYFCLYTRSEYIKLLKSLEKKPKTR